MNNIQLFIQIGFLLAFAFFVGLNEYWKHDYYVNPSSMINVFKFLQFSKLNLDRNELEKLGLSLSYDKSSQEFLPEKYKLLMKKFDEFAVNKLFTYKELHPLFKTSPEKKDFIEIFAVSIIVVVIRILSIVLSPFVVFITLFEHLKEKNNKVDWSLLVAPETRSEMVMQQIGGICVIIAYVLIYFTMKPGNISIQMMLFIILIPTLAVAFSFLRMLLNQNRAKEKWLEVFDYIMQKAILNNEYDLYNTAFNHYQTVKAFPAAPLTVIAKTYLAINAIIQVLINFIFSLYK